MYESKTIDVAKAKKILRDCNVPEDLISGILQNAQAEHGAVSLRRLADLVAVQEQQMKIKRMNSDLNLSVSVSSKGDASPDPITIMDLDQTADVRARSVSYGNMDDTMSPCEQQGRRLDSILQKHNSKISHITKVTKGPRYRRTRPATRWLRRRDPTPDYLLPRQMQEAGSPAGSSSLRDSQLESVESPTAVGSPTGQCPGVCCARLCVCL